MDRKPARSVRFLILAALVLLFLSRMPALMHSAWLHPDEPVFLISARKLTQFLLGQGDSYVPQKFYPEGGFVLHTPLQLIAQLVFGWIPVDDRMLGRITGCLYFLGGSGLGLWILRRYFSKDGITTAVYLSTLFFGLIHIEQSRYATGDTATFLLLMLLVLFSAKGMETGKLRFFLLAAVMGGMLTSVKYPLIYFLLIPYLGFRKVFHSEEKKTVARNTGKAALCWLFGYLFLSPKTLTDPTYLFWTLAHETHNYMAGTNLTEVGGPLNHLISLVLFTLLYSGVPLLTGAAVWQVGRKSISFQKADGLDYLFRFLIPVLAGGFFLYNLFVTAVFMRTYYPFFCLLDIYCAALCGQWFRENGIKRLTVIAMCICLCLRGGYLLHILSTDVGNEQMQAFMDANISSEDYSFVTELKPGRMAFTYNYTDKEISVVDLKEERFSTPEGLHLQEGELLISAYQEFGISTPYFLPISNKAVQEYIDIWQQFKDVNSEYYLGTLYPIYYYWLFGFWVKGTTGMYFEFPSNTFYLRPIA